LIVFISSGNENINIVFRVYHRRKWIDLRQAKTKMIVGPFYTIAEYISSAEMLCFSDNLQSVIIRDGCMSQQPSGRALFSESITTKPPIGRIQS